LTSQLNMEIVKGGAFRFGAHNQGLSNAVFKDRRVVCKGNPSTNRYQGSQDTVTSQQDLE
ncbi:hypothetical protein, partial [Ruegeria denitrificans]|uniref:hypothetical protein n=1 Tax=Ruegeria denitrificans TaxID=1715692 RepID=UPI001A946FD6